MTNNPETPATPENLTPAQKIIADRTRWVPDGKNITVTLETPDEQALAYGIRSELQRQVRGRTPNIQPHEGKLFVTTQTIVYNQAHQQITRQNSR